MKIFVCNKYDMEKKEIETPEFFDDDKFFIAIKNGNENSFPYSYNEKNVLKLTFDNYTSFDKLELENKNVDDYVLFTNKMASKIFNFINTLNPKKLLYINSEDGLSRAGAIGLVANEYLNKFLINNTEDYYFFFKINKQIKPNKEIVEMLMDKFFQGFENNIQFPDF